MEYPTKLSAEDKSLQKKKCGDLYTLHSQNSWPEKLGVYATVKEKCLQIHRASNIFKLYMYICIFLIKGEEKPNRGKGMFEEGS